MENGLILKYDGSFNGFLTVVYEAFENKYEIADIRTEEQSQQGLFYDTEMVSTDMVKAKRVWYAVRKKNYDAIKQIYFAFLSEEEGIEKLLYSYIRTLYYGKEKHSSNSYDELAGKIYSLNKIVGKEKKSVESSLSLKPFSGGLSVTYISPQFNVLPLISRYFRLTHNTHPWVIFDRKRNYGLYFNGIKVGLINSIPEMTFEPHSKRRGQIKAA